MSEAGDAPLPTSVFLPDNGDVYAAINILHTSYAALVSDLNNHANGTTARLDALESRADSAGNTLSAISANLATLLARFPVATSSLQSSSSSSTAAHPRPIKGAKLSQFSGKAQDVERFLTDLRDDIELQGPSTFTTDYQKSIYMATFLRDTQSASDWMSGIRGTSPTLLSDFPKFTDAFAKHFGSANKVEDALRKLKALKQIGSAATYAARFRELSAALPQEEFFLKTMFFDGLKEEVRAWIYGMPDGKEGTLDQLIERAISGDNRIHEFQSATASKATPWTAPKSKPASSSTHTPSPSAAPAPSSSSSGPVPMELGAARVAGPLDPSEKERRKKLGLCIYCGGSHTTNNCQLLKEKNARKATRKGKANPQA